MKRTLSRAFALGGSLLLAGGLLVAAASQSHAADPLISRSKPTTTSSNENSTLTGLKAVDGNLSTRWGSLEGQDPQWIQIDLGAAARISQVVLKWEAAYGKAYKIQTSADASTWTDIYSTTTGNGATDDLAVTGTGRYVRMYGTARGTQWGYSLFEFEVYGSTGPIDSEKPTPPKNLRSTGATPTTVSLAWDAATDNVAVTAYDVYQHGQFVTSVPGNQLTATARGLSPNTEYDFTVFAKDATPNVSDASNVVIVKTPPSQEDNQPPTPPTNLRSTGVTSTSVSLAWNASDDNVGVVRYDIFNGDTKVGESTTTSATIGGLTPSTEYTFRARAYDAAGNSSGPSNPATAKTSAPTGGGTNPGTVTEIASSTDVPWGLAFLPDGSALMAERDTFNVTRVTRAGQKTTVGKVPNGSGTGGEGGNLGLEISPTFAVDNWVYIYHTSPSDNRIVRMKYSGGSLSDHQVLLTGIPRNRFHNGGRLRFGPDGKLYAGTGDAQNGANAQNPNNKGGKVLRINPDGSIPADNPISGNPLWSLGHRNVQGLAFDSRGRLWEGELGNSSQDELNLIVKGGNYGWPNCEGSCNDARFINPKRTWSVSSNSPSGIAIVKDVIFMAALRGARLYRMAINGDSVSTPTSHYQGTYGRLRTVEPSPDGHLWMTSSNGDKDSTPNNSNTKILHVQLTGGSDPGPGPFALTSTAYKNGGAIPDKYSCAHDGGAGNDISPPLAWTTGNHAARSWAITFIDLANGGKHWAIWDIPASVTSLPEALQRGYNVPNVPGAKQKAMGAASVNQQFFGPCPRSQHTYEFTLYAINVDTLPGLSQSSTVAQVETAAKANDIASTKLSGTSSAAP
jgi:Raf kinase inhibitor-like YbhB/YbcL family protein